MKKKLLITGGSGLVGSTIAVMAAADFDVWATFNSQPSEIPGCTFIQLDVRDEQRVNSVLGDVQPNLVIHAAALCSPDYCEDHAEEAWATNADGTKNVAAASKKIAAKLIYVSTDSVFDGNSGMYSEDDTPHPPNTYSRTKLEGERCTRSAIPDSIIVRTSGVYGRSLSGRRSLSEWIAADLKEGKTLEMTDDAFFSATLVTNLARVLLEMHGRNLGGTYHVAGSERCSKYTFAKELTAILGFDTERVRPTTLDQISLKAARPRDSSLAVGKVSNCVDTRLLGVRQGILTMVQEGYATA